MDQKILIVGRDRVNSTRLTTLLSCRTLSEYSWVHLKSISSIKNALKTASASLILINLKHENRIENFLNYLQEYHYDIPVLIISSEGEILSQSLIEKGAQFVIPASHIDSDFLPQCILSAMRQKRIENELRMREGIQKAVNYAAEVFLSQKDWESRLKDVLKHFGKSIQSDRAYLFKNEQRVAQDLIAVLQAEWTNVGIKPLCEFSDSTGESYFSFGYSRWLHVFQKDEMIFGNVLDLPLDEQSQLIRRGVQSLLVIPVFSDQILWGFIGFDHCYSEKKWLTAELDTLKTAAKIIGAALSRQDAEIRLTHLATHDYLTNLPNRMLFADRFELAISRSERSGKKIGIVAIDLDKFKTINDTYGHPFGDKVLIEVAWRLSEAVRSSDTCARVGGDEFAVLAEGMENKKDLLRVMEKISQSLEQVMLIDGRRIQISASMGASIYPNHGTTLEQLIKTADIALYQIKETYAGYKVYIDEQYSLLDI
jgi:diguanylate cyclase (GGDEF)-like protein